jgi:hypothetical protein
VIKLRINVNIDELVLEGFDRKDSSEIVMAMRLELARLIMEEDLYQSIDNDGNESFRTNNKTQVIYVDRKYSRDIGMQIAHFLQFSLRKRSLFYT